MLLALWMLALPAFGAGPPLYQPRVVNPELVGATRVAAPSPAFFTWGSDATILRSDDGRAWRHADTPGSADLTQLAANANGSVLVAVGARGTILRSTDLGSTWQAARNPMVDTDLQAVVHAGERVWIAAGTAGRILRSIDDARTWKLIESRLSATMRALRVDGDRLLLGGDEGLVGYSKDRGESWQVTAIAMPGEASPITGFHRFGTLLLATSALGRFLTSEDGGDSWDLMQSSSPAFYVGVTRDPDHDTLVMVGHNGDVMRSRDGRSWESGEVLIDGRRSFLTGLAYDAQGHALLVTGQGGTVARSTDGGNTWTPTEPGLRVEVRGLVAIGNGEFMVYGAGGLLATVRNSGKDWGRVREALDAPLREVLPSPRGNALVATSRLGDLLRSTDSGDSWRAVTPRFPNENTPPDLRGLIVTPSRAAMIAVGPPGAILRGDADGTAWRPVVWNEIEAERAFPWIFADARRGLLVAVEARGALMFSRDDGENWTRANAPLGALRQGEVPLWHGAALESRGLMIIGGEGGRAFRSRDAPESWEPMNVGTDAHFYGSYADEPTGNLFLAGSKGTLLRSTDLGDTWAAVAPGSSEELRRVFRDPRSRALLCVGTHGTILRSEDDGRRWRPVPSGTQGVLREWLMEPGTGHLLVVGSQGALLRSTDGGRSWQKLDTHTARHFEGLAADPRTGDLVLVGERIVRLVRR